MKQNRSTLGKDAIEFESLMKLIEGIVLLVLDHVSISGKWYPRENISMETLLKKKGLLTDMGKWMKTEDWNIWTGIYSEYSKANRYYIKKKFEKIRKESMKYVNTRIKKYKTKLANKKNG